MITVLRAELVAIKIAAIPPNKQLGTMKLKINLLNFSFVAKFTIKINKICIEHRWKGRSLLGNTPLNVAPVAAS